MGKKIVILGTAFPYRGGMAALNERVAREFIKEGHDVRIYTFRLQYPSFLFPGKTQYSNSAAPDDLDIYRKVNSVNPLNWLKVAKELKNLRPNFVLFRYWLPFMGPCFGSIARLIRKNKHTKIISIADNVIPHEKRPGDRLFTKYFVRSCHAFVAMSKSVFNDLLKFDKKTARRLTPHPLYDNYGKALSKVEAKQSLGLDLNTNYLLFFGLVRSYKGLDWLLEAFAEAKKNIEDLKLIVAGEFYADKQNYLDIIRKHQLEQSIILHDSFIPDEDVAKYFCAADLVVQPYKNATQSGVTQIGYHFEKPMLVTKVGGLGEIIPHMKVGYAVEPEVEAITEAIIDFYKNNREESFVKGAVQEKAKYAWSKMTAAILDLYEEVGGK